MTHDFLLTSLLLQVYINMSFRQQLQACQGRSYIFVDRHIIGLILLLRKVKKKKNCLGFVTFAICDVDGRAGTGRVHQTLLLVYSNCSDLSARMKIMVGR